MELSREEQITRALTSFRKGLAVIMDQPDIAAWKQVWRAYDIEVIQVAAYIIKMLPPKADNPNWLAWLKLSA